MIILLWICFLSANICIITEDNSIYPAIKFSIFFVLFSEQYNGSISNNEHISDTHFCPICFTLSKFTTLSYNCNACMFTALDVTNWILYELAKLSGEIRQLRRIIEKQSVSRPRSSSVEDVIPEIVDGPVNSIEDCRALLNSCGRKASQDYLVGNVTFCSICNKSLQGSYSPWKVLESQWSLSRPWKVLKL